MNCGKTNPIEYNYMTTTEPKAHGTSWKRDQKKFEGQKTKKFVPPRKGHLNEAQTMTISIDTLMKNIEKF